MSISSSVLKSGDGCKFLPPFQHNFSSTESYFKAIKKQTQQQGVFKWHKVPNALDNEQKSMFTQGLFLYFNNSGPHSKPQHMKVGHKWMCLCIMLLFEWLFLFLTVPTKLFKGPYTNLSEQHECIVSSEVLGEELHTVALQSRDCILLSCIQSCHHSLWTNVHLIRIQEPGQRKPKSCGVKPENVP